MSNRRREDTAKREGTLSDKDRQIMVEDVDTEIQRRSQKEAWRAELKNDSLFKFVKWGKLGKDVLDGVLGLAPVVGDIMSFSLGAINIYFCAGKVKSIGLTLIVALMVILDMALGFIPGAGDIADFIFPSNYLSGRLIEKYIDGECRWIDYLSWLIVLGFFAAIGLAIYLLFFNH